MSAPRFTAGASRGTPATLNLDDIFGDVMFTPDGDTVFLSEQQDDDDDMVGSGESEISMMARKQKGSQYVPVQQGGGLYTTNLHEREKSALVMGSAGDAAPTPLVPYKKAPQERNHLQYAMPKSKKSSRSSDRKMSEEQKVERR